ncbi:MAG: AAA family ATPase [Novosphingobium sp.]
MIQALTKHPSMTGWVKSGLDYHVGQSLAECLHCGQPLTSERIAALQASFDASYDDHVSEIEASGARIDILMETLRSISSSLPSGEIPADLVGQFNYARAKLRDAGRRCDAMLRAVRQSLVSKYKGPNLAVLVELPEAIDTCDELDAAINDAITIIASVVEMHNHRNSEFANEQAQARADLKGHHLSDGHADYLRLRSAFTAADTLRNVRSRLAERHAQRLAGVRDRLRSHGPAIETVNKLLKSFLGHSELSLTTDGEGYRIQRRGKNAVGPLSEGERTAVAFCYYLTKLEEDGRKKKDVIAVVDDPISSLDTKALNYAFSLLKRSLTDTSQLIVMTHNMDFMNEAKKWLKSRAYPRDVTKQPDASLFFISTVVSPCGTIRSASIGELPTLLREYDSEYHYLFSLIYLFSEGRADEFAYLMPNAMRKVLELFLAFKCPGSSGVESKLEQAIVRDCGIDPASLAAVARLTNLESHGDSLDDLITLPSMTVEESKNAAASLFQLIELLDPEHLKGMKKLATNANPAPPAPPVAEPASAPVPAPVSA